jgi:hypothetical protein
MELEAQHRRCLVCGLYYLPRIELGRSPRSWWAPSCDCRARLEEVGFRGRRRKDEGMAQRLAYLEGVVGRPPPPSPPAS